MAADEQTVTTGDYGKFEDGMGKVDKVNADLEEQKNTILGYMESLNSEGVFMGPICKSCVDGFGNVNKKIKLDTANFSTIKDYIGKALANYLSADKKAETYLDLKNGKIVETTIPPVMTIGASEIIPNLSGNTTREKVYDYLKKAGFNSAVISGIMANINAESGFQLSVNGDGGWSHGLCQWYRGRNTALRNYCKKHNLRVDSAEGQMAFMMYELKHSYNNSVIKKLKNIPNTRQGAYEAASIWTKYYEIPANTNTQAHNRGKAAQTTYWDMYGDK